MVGAIKNDILYFNEHSVGGKHGYDLTNRTFEPFVEGKYVYLFSQ